MNTNSYFKICGHRALKGEVEISGAKNSILPLLFASLLAEGDHEFQNVPNLKDVHSALRILSSLGFTHTKKGSQLLLQNFNYTGADPCPDSARSFRASILCLGALLSRFGRVKIPLPGGCRIGSRPINIHLDGLKKLGANIEIKEGCIYGTAPKGGLKAASITLEIPSVGATENLIMACVLTKGISHLKNLACEPEIEDLIMFLKNLGAQIEWISTREVKIEGVSRLHSSSKPYFVIPDRIEAGTLLLAAAITKGEIRLKKCRSDHLSALLEKLEETGCFIEQQKEEIFLKSKNKLKAVHIKTGVYPFFPTDLQSQFLALMTQLDGSSSLEETIFENRFRYTKALNKLGAKIHIQDNRKAFVQGSIPLEGTSVEATDLRAGAGLILAGLISKGETRVYGLHHINRGYDNICLKLKSLNADIQVLEEDTV